MVPRLFLYTRVDDRRSWWWRRPEVLERLEELSIEVAAVVPVHRVRRWGHPLKELMGLPGDVGLWLWIGGARDEAIDRTIARFGGLKNLLEVAKRSGFDGVVGIDYTVYLDACTESDVLRVVEASRRLVEEARAVGMDVVPQARLCRPSDAALYRSLSTNVVAYNAIHDLRDGLSNAVRSSLSLLSAIGLSIVPIVSGYGSELAFLRSLAGVEIHGIAAGIRCEHLKWRGSKYVECITDIIESAASLLLDPVTCLAANDPTPPCRRAVERWLGSNCLV